MNGPQHKTRDLRTLTKDLGSRNQEKRAKIQDKESRTQDLGCMTKAFVLYYISLFGYSLQE